MKVEVCDSVAPKDWDARVCAVGGTIYHSSIWALYNKTSFPRIIPRFFSLFAPDGECRGVALGFYECSTHPLLKRFSRRLWFDAIPATCANDSDTLSRFLQLIEQQACGSGAVELFIDSFAYLSGGMELEKAGFDITRRLEFELRLEASEEDLWKGMDYTRSKKIRRALKLGVTVLDLPPKEGLSDLRRLQSESSQRIVARGGPDITSHKQAGQDPVAVLLDSGCARVIGAQLDGAIVSATLFTSFNSLVYSHLSGHTQEGFKSQAGTLLLWETIKRYRQEGARRFNMGGCQIEAMNEESPEHGVYVYKKAFGGTIIECWSGRKTLRKRTNAVVNTLKSLIGRAQVLG